MRPLALSRAGQDVFLPAAAAVLLSGALIAWRGGTVWLLRLGWIALIAGFLILAPGGLFEGGIVMIPAFFLLLAGSSARCFRSARNG